MRPWAHGVRWSVTLALWAVAAFAVAVVDLPAEGFPPLLVQIVVAAMSALTGMAVLSWTSRRWWLPGAKAPGLLAGALFSVTLVVAWVRVLAAMATVDFGRVFGGAFGG